MNEYELDIDDFSDEEIQQFLEEADQEYQEFHSDMGLDFKKITPE